MLPIFSWILFLVFCLPAQINLSGQTADWELRKDQDGIKVYTRAEKESFLDEFRGEAMIPASIDRLVQILHDADHMKDWIPDCADSRLISLGKDEQYHYLVSSLPFPLHNRDTYVQFKYVWSADGLTVIITGLPDYGPEEDGLVRIPHLTGFWIFKRVSEMQTHTTYQVLADPGGAVPIWLANSTTVSTPFNTLKNLRKYVQK